MQNLRTASAAQPMDFIQKLGDEYMPHIKPIAKVINNNQPGWTNIIETEPNVTLDIGTELYLVDEPDVKPDVYSYGLGDTILKNGKPLVNVAEELNLLAIQRADYLRRLMNIQKWST